MAWKKPSPELTALFEQHVPEIPGVQVRPMFGCRTAFLNGNMFFGTFQDALVFRVGEEALERFLEKNAGSELFRPMPKMAMKGWAMVPEKHLPPSASLKRWIRQCLEYAATLKPKAPKAKKKPALRPRTS